VSEDNVVPLPKTGEPSVTDPANITPAELRALIDWMGLTRKWFGTRVGFGERTVVRWADGHTAIPEKAGVELVRLWNQSAEAIATMVKGATERAVNGVVVLKTFRVDSEYHEAMGSEEYPASWHRAMTCRAMDHILMNTKYEVRIEFWEAV